MEVIGDPEARGCGKRVVLWFFEKVDPLKMALSEEWLSPGPVTAEAISAGVVMVVVVMVVVVVESDTCRKCRGHLSSFANSAGHLVISVPQSGCSEGPKVTHVTSRLMEPHRGLDLDFSEEIGGLWVCLLDFPT